ncbi:hypothetical protein KIH39_08975 [Telmatocola sphagniphila]|uniref:Uncharacterized protein n=1 Tax=Telmatocola sphagniphila TaxID=1123043 RepID=A0A8E6B936_9BACT|nr:hypothetical protein [Telmatocola sphagniphila]QVL34021.1 hypothetical protein KIH39_08975 [Telmatocola sphagniphila]
MRNSPNSVLNLWNAHVLLGGCSMSNVGLEYQMLVAEYLAIPLQHRGLANGRKLLNRMATAWDKMTEFDQQEFWDSQELQLGSQETVEC